MKTLTRPSRLEWISFFILMPFLCLLLNYLLFGKIFFTDPDKWMISFPLIFLIGFISFYIQIITMRWLRLKFPDVRQTSLRLTILTLAQISIVYLTNRIIFNGYDAFEILGYNFDHQMFKIALFLGIGLTMIATAMWEADYSLKLWKDSLAEKEKLEQLTIIHEFEALKSQVNPHFLFNCFNTLSSLISEDRKQAEVFLDELSKVYRYLLRNNEDGLSTLQTEVRFIESYYRLLRTRHGEAVQLKTEIDKKYDQYLLPSLSLQMLVENAVKHNVLSRNKPLMIDIFTTSGNKLVVSNNLQIRSVKSASNRIGLENIKSKYDLLNYNGFQVLQDKKSFSVVLPLIWSKVADQKLVNIQT
jgi:two-component system, LytTR family, sensor kinase